MKIEIVNPLTFAHWDEILLDHPDATIFHTSHWARVLHESYGYKPVYFAAVENRYLKFLLPFMDVNSILTGRRGVSLPFTDYCRVILPEGDDFLDYFYMVERYARKARWKYFELRSDANIPDTVQASTIFYRHLLNLGKGEEALHKGLRASTRRNIKKATSTGVTVVMETSRDALKQFYTLHCQTRKLHGLPPQPFHFFDKLYEHILSNGFGFVALAYQGKQVVSGNVYLHYGHCAVYKYGASDKRYQHFRANNLLKWEAIRWYADRGFRQLCFGRTELDNAGLLQFKRGWGAVETELFYHRLNLQDAAFIKILPKVDSGLQKRLFGVMPLPLLRLAGKLLYRHVG